MQTKNHTTKPETELKEETGEGCPGATCSALPDAAGFYWWRETDRHPWRMVHIVNFAADSDIPYLAAYDVEHRCFGGRTLIQWARHEPIGQWIPIHKPNAKHMDPPTLDSAPTEKP